MQSDILTLDPQEVLTLRPKVPMRRMFMSSDTFSLLKVYRNRKVSLLLKNNSIVIGVIKNTTDEITVIEVSPSQMLRPIKIEEIIGVDIH